MTYLESPLLLAVGGARLVPRSTSIDFTFFSLSAQAVAVPDKIRNEDEQNNCNNKMRKNKNKKEDDDEEEESNYSTINVLDVGGGRTCHPPSDDKCICFLCIFFDPIGK